MFPPQLYTRREILKSVSSGVGYLAFAALAHQQARAEAVAGGKPLDPKLPHFKARAKRVIFLSMQGAPSHIDTFDYKPQLAKDHGKAGRTAGARGGTLMGSKWEFKQRGKSGLWISELFPNVARMADELCMLNGMHTDIPNHPQAQVQMHTGSFQFVRPSLGAWTLYGLGTENANLPGFVALNPGAGNAQHIGSAFLPAIYQGTPFGNGGRRRFARGGNQEVRIPNIKNPNLTKDQQRAQLDFIQKLNEEKLRREQHQPGVEGVIESYELAFRMQDELPELMDINRESKETLDLYGIDGSETDGFGRQCLLARRFAEEGVRFVELTHGNWDHHRNLSQDLPARCREIDKPIAGLLEDLKRRDMLKDTLVVWAGEFGRTPHAQGGDGRDHNNKGYTTWMAGGGVKGGFSYGATDEYGYEAVDGRLHIHDWHATILHALGLDHEKLTYRHAGRDFRLTDVHGNVAHDIFA
ncbi:sulfatase [Haloferula helveola]|uniref:Sulfatase n=1 Tax=Haloferula helveola TaxID=490095 RepID=A0ABM7RF59_9BACT|nr:sulfatase [Haloferula helveola]